MGDGVWRYSVRAGVRPIVNYGLRRALSDVATACMRPFGYLAFLIAALSLAGCARLLGREDPLGAFSGRLADALSRHPEVVRPGMRVAWVLWAIAFALACSPLDPLASWWDELILGTLALGVAWHRIFTLPQAGSRRSL